MTGALSHSPKCMCSMNTVKNPIHVMSAGIKKTPKISEEREHEFLKENKDKIIQKAFSV